MDYEKIIMDLGNKIAQLTINESILMTRVQEEMKLKEEVEAKYVEVMNELRYYKPQNATPEEPKAIPVTHEGGNVHEQK